MDSSATRWMARAEPWFFGALVLLHAVPVLAFTWFPTLDGPVHLYNARIITRLLHGDPITSQLFELNPFPEPNWLGHAIMALVMSISTAQAAEKVVMLLYVVGLPLTFRFALRRLGAPALWPALLIFPFIYCFTFRIGFLNFSLGLPLLLLALGVGAGLHRHPTRRNIVALGALLTLLYFAHLTCFLLAVGLLLALSLWGPAANPDVRGRLRACKLPLLAASPGLVLCAAFFLSHADTRVDLERLPVADVMSSLLNGRPFVSLSDAEAPYARIISWAMLALSLSVLLNRREGNVAHPRERWLPLGILVLLAACFIVPDQMATGGFITVRLMLFTYLLWALWLGMQWTTRWWNTLLLGVALLADLLLLPMHYDYTKGLNRELAEMTVLTPLVPEGAVIVPLNYSGNWMHSNWPCYLGTLCHAEVLDNFGARTAHMPVRWLDGSDPSEVIGTYTTSDRPCVGLNAQDPGEKILFDHVLTFRLREDIADSCTNAVRTQLDSSFEELAVPPSGAARLYRRR